MLFWQKWYWIQFSPPCLPLYLSSSPRSSGEGSVLSPFLTFLHPYLVFSPTCYRDSGATTLMKVMNWESKMVIPSIPAVHHWDLCLRQGKWQLQATFLKPDLFRGRSKESYITSKCGVQDGRRRNFILSILASGKVPSGTEKMGQGDFPHGVPISGGWAVWCQRWWADSVHNIIYFRCMEEWKPFMCMLANIWMQKKCWKRGQTFLTIKQRYVLAPL